MTTENSMEANEKACPYCAETIKSGAIRCRHCQADLTVPHAVTVQAKGIGFFGKFVLFLLLAGAAFLGFGFYLSNTPEGKEKARQRNAIEMCHRQEGTYTGPSGAKSIITGACQKLETDFRSRFGVSP